MPTLEKDIQKKVVAYAKSLGFRPFKRSTYGPYGKSGDPDYEFNRNGYTFFIEFKAPGKHSTPKQKKMQEELMAQNFAVYECDDVQFGIDTVDEEFMRSEGMK